MGVFLFILSYSSPLWAKNDDTLLVLGDSLSAAYGLPVEDGWVSLLQKKLRTTHPQIRVVNASISGETTSGGKSRLPELLSRHHPQWVILELGANDALRGQQLQSTRANLRRMIELSRQAGAKVMLLGIRLPTNYGPAYDQMLQSIYRQLAKDYQLIFDPFFLEPVALDPDLMQLDGLHPNAKGQPRLLQRLWPKIEQLIRP